MLPPVKASRIELPGFTAALSGSDNFHGYVAVPAVVDLMTSLKDPSLSDADRADALAMMANRLNAIATEAMPFPIADEDDEDDGPVDSEKELEKHRAAAAKQTEMRENFTLERKARAAKVQTILADLSTFPAVNDVSSALDVAKRAAELNQSNVAAHLAVCSLSRAAGKMSPEEEKALGVSRKAAACAAFAASVEALKLGASPAVTEPAPEKSSELTKKLWGVDPRSLRLLLTSIVLPTATWESTLRVSLNTGTVGNDAGADAVEYKVRDLVAAMVELDEYSPLAWEVAQTFTDARKEEVDKEVRAKFQGIAGEEFERLAATGATEHDQLSLAQSLRERLGAEVNANMPRISVFGSDFTPLMCRARAVETMALTNAAFGPDVLSTTMFPRDPLPIGYRDMQHLGGLHKIARDLQAHEVIVLTIARSTASKSDEKAPLVSVGTTEFHYLDSEGKEVKLTADLREYTELTAVCEVLSEVRGDPNVWGMAAENLLISNAAQGVVYSKKTKKITAYSPLEMAVQCCERAPHVKGGWEVVMAALSRKLSEIEQEHEGNLHDPRFAAEGPKFVKTSDKRFTIIENGVPAVEMLGVVLPIQAIQHFGQNPPRTPQDFTQRLEFLLRRLRDEQKKHADLAAQATEAVTSGTGAAAPPSHMDRTVSKAVKAEAAEKRGTKTAAETAAKSEASAADVTKKSTAPRVDLGVDDVEITKHAARPGIPTAAVVVAVVAAAAVVGVVALKLRKQ